jgi:hypothetical protein
MKVIGAVTDSPQLKCERGCSNVAGFLDVERYVFLSLPRMSKEERKHEFRWRFFVLLAISKWSDFIKQAYVSRIVLYYKQSSKSSCIPPGALLATF